MKRTESAKRGRVVPKAVNIVLILSVIAIVVGGIGALPPSQCELYLGSQVRSVFPTTVNAGQYINIHGSVFMAKGDYSFVHFYEMPTYWPGLAVEATDYREWKLGLITAQVPPDLPPGEYGIVVYNNKEGAHYYYYYKEAWEKGRWSPLIVQ